MINLNKIIQYSNNGIEVQKNNKESNFKLIQVKQKTKK